MAKWYKSELFVAIFIGVSYNLGFQAILNEFFVVPIILQFLIAITIGGLSGYYIPDLMKNKFKGTTESDPVAAFRESYFPSEESKIYFDNTISTNKKN